MRPEPVRIREMKSMNLQNTITTLHELGELMNPERPDVQAIADRAYQHNKWFTSENVFLMLNNIRLNFLHPEKLQRWLSDYSFEEPQPQKTVGIVMAGNIPLVGFHDLICVMVAGHKALIKLSSKDDILLPWVLKKLLSIDESWKHSIAIAEMLNGMDAVIATGSKNSSRYFEYYFSKYPHIIRKNRGTVAILQGDESNADLQGLGKDIFSYFGLGCRNVSKLFVPKDYSFDLFFDSIVGFSNVINHNKYKNNYDYNRTLLLMNKEPHVANEFMMLREDKRIVSPVAMMHYEYYYSEEQLKDNLKEQSENIQCISGSGFIPFGDTQSPSLSDYADKVDTLEFLQRLK